MPKIFRLMQELEKSSQVFKQQGEGGLKTTEVSVVFSSMF